MKKMYKLMMSACAAAMTLSLSVMNAFAEGEAANTAGQPAKVDWMQLFLPLLFFVIVIYFFMIRPQKKKEKETKAMQDGIQIGDEIVTIGGIVGMVVRKGDDNVVIETGGEKNKMRIKLWAISENTSAIEREKEAKNNRQAEIAAMSSAKLKDDEDGDKKSKKKKKDSEKE